jgi:hypothetical protein
MLFSLYNAFEDSSSNSVVDSIIVVGFRFVSFFSGLFFHPLAKQSIFIICYNSMISF